MKIVSGMVQGDQAWHAHRAQHWNASDAPTMLGISPFKSRSELIRERATGIVDAEIDPATAKRFADGHRFEALARPMAEAIIGDELFPITGVSDCGRFSSSFDGLTMAGDVAWEHKTLNDELRAALDSGAGLPEHYRAQMEHQLLVSDAARVLFIASKWNGDTLDSERHCWYYPDPGLRARIIAGWEQFERDVAAYAPEPTPPPAAVAAPVAGFGALSLRVEGRVLASNLDAFRAGAEAFVARLPKPSELQTDQDFADAEGAVKACSEAETRIAAATDAALAQMADVDAVLRTAGEIREAIRAARLALDKAVKAEKESRKARLVVAGADAVRAHYTTINLTLPPEHALGVPAATQSDIGASIKSLRTLSSMRDAIDAAVANAKIAASQQADRVRANIAVLAEHAEHAHLFADRVGLCATKAPDDLRAIASQRVAEREREEAARLEAERERIRAEEAARVERERAAAEHAESGRVAGNAPSAAPAPIAAEPATAGTAPAAPTGAARDSGARIKLGDICALIAPLSITADGLAQLGFRSVGTDRAAKLYAESDWPAICTAIVDVVQRARSQRVAA